jgi:hypothetical protein
MQNEASYIKNRGRVSQQPRHLGIYAKSLGNKAMHGKAPQNSHNSTQYGPSKRKKISERVLQFTIGASRHQR